MASLLTKNLERKLGLSPIVLRHVLELDPDAFHNQLCFWYLDNTLACLLFERFQSLQRFVEGGDRLDGFLPVRPGYYSNRNLESSAGIEYTLSFSIRPDVSGYHLLGKI